ncbi:MAG: bacillithiol biosynthesis BshC [Candidatus Eisenbacteria bacterium]
MKPIGRQGDRPVPPRADAGARPARASLAEESPERYRDLMRLLGERSELPSDSIDALAEGRMAVILTGQQPGLLGGPLYTLYKVLTAVAQARRVREAGSPAIAAFWCVGDDTDHDEVAPASWPRPGEAPRRLRDEKPAEGRRIGGLELERMAPARALLTQDWPGSIEALAAIDACLAQAEDEGGGWSAFLRAVLRALVRPEQLLFVDGGAPEVVAAAQSWLWRFLPHRSRLAAGIAAQAAHERAEGREPALEGEEASRALFVLEGDGRRPLGLDEPVAPGATLLPNVVLRPALQEHLLPVSLVICGDGEIAYRKLLGPVYELLGRPAAPLASRFAATLFPPVFGGDPLAPDPVALLEETDAAIERWGRSEIDPALLERLAEARAQLSASLADLDEPLGALDPSLAQLARSAGGKADFQLGRIEEAILAKGRQKLRRTRPELADLKESLLPRGRPQERSFTLWTPLLYEGSGAMEDLLGAVRDWLEAGRPGQTLLALREPAADGETGAGAAPGRPAVEAARADTAGAPGAPGAPAQRKEER